ncbi:IclR family transcriptional regulator [Amorphus sp. 3PC139-8]|uniref:IclR family transcriptional regulator n=1 Tax=Amorphus sp. 3PC139-8 TaxID=2735676 RepID=UPI00345D47C7
MVETDGKAHGTQAIRRAAGMLRFVASGSGAGVSLNDVSKAMELSRSTAHRILKCLVEEGLLETDETGRRYRVGALTYELGLAASGRRLEVLRWRDTVDRLGRETGATMYLMGRTGLDSVCLYKADGTGVVRVFPVEVGQRRPLGVGAGATALLAGAPDDEVDRILAAIAPELGAYPSITAETIRADIAKARRTGVAESLGQVVSEAYGLGVAIPSGQGAGTLALSLAAHRSLAVPERTAVWKRLLLEAARTPHQEGAVDVHNDL